MTYHVYRMEYSDSFCGRPITWVVSLKTESKDAVEEFVAGLYSKGLQETEIQIFEIKEEIPFSISVRNDDGNKRWECKMLDNRVEGAI